MMEGQVQEVQAAFDPGRTQDAYLAAIAGKTASLMATACRIGGLTAGLDRPDVEAVTTFGECLGMVFQIRDDILDVVASDHELGKPAGQDLMEGVYTLPVLAALADPEVGPGLALLLGRPLDGPDLDRAREVVSSAGVGLAAQEARRWAHQAVDATACLDDSAVSDALRTLAYGLVDTVPVPMA
jgi:heptaprenyl diphosphate synthase